MECDEGAPRGRSFEAHQSSSSFYLYIMFLFVVFDLNRYIHATSCCI